MFEQSPMQQEESDLILAHFNPEELDFMDQLQGGPSWMEVGDGMRIREYSALEGLPHDPQMRSLFEQAAQGEEEPQMPPGMAHGGRPQGIPEEVEEIKDQGRHGDTEVALIPIDLAEFFNELIGYPSHNKDNVPEYFDLNGTLGSIGNGLKSVGRFAGNTLATAAPYVGQGAGYLLGSTLGGGEMGAQIGGALGRGIGRIGQGLWNQESLPQALGQGAYQGGATYLQPQLQKAAGMSPANVNINPQGSPRDQAIPQMINELSPLAGPALGAIGGPLGAGIGSGLARAGTGMLNGESGMDAMRNGFKAGAWETGMPVVGNAIGSGIFNRNQPIQTPPLQTQPMAHGGMVNSNPYSGFPEYGGFFKGISNAVSGGARSLGSVFKAAAPLIGGMGGFMLGGPMGAGIGAGLGGTAAGMGQGLPFGQALGQGALQGGMAYAIPSLMGSAGSAFGLGGGNAGASIPASQAGQLMTPGAAQNMAPQMAAQNSGGLLGGLGKILNSNALPLAAMTGMSLMGRRDEQKRLKDWERKEDQRREKYENAFGTFSSYKMPKAKERKMRPYEGDMSTYGERGEHRFFEDEPLSEARGGAIPGIGKGQQDNIDARLSPDEYVMDADTVAAFGDGSSRAGALVLDKVRENLRKHKRQSVKGIPPKAKPFDQYMPVKSKKKFAGLGR